MSYRDFVKSHAGKGLKLAEIAARWQEAKGGSAKPTGGTATRKAEKPKPTEGTATRKAENPKPTGGTATRKAKKPKPKGKCADCENKSKACKECGK